MKAPSFNLTGSGVLGVAGLAVVGLAAAWLYANRQKLAGAAQAALATVNPADDRNAAYSAVSAVGQAVTGRDGWTLGGMIADWFPSSAERELTRQWSTPPQTVDQAVLDANDARARRGTGAGEPVTTDYRPLDPFDMSTWAAP